MFAHSHIGKQGRTSHPQDDPTTQVSPVNVHQQASQNHRAVPPQHHYATSDPSGNTHQQPQGQMADAQAGNAAAQAAGTRQQAATKKKVDAEDLARIVAEENESKGKLPKYPGLERWQLLEKMGDGAFINVYRARDLDGKAGEVAIKVVRKFEMNSSQVSLSADGYSPPSLFGLPYQRAHGLVGRCTPSSELQEGAKSSGGANIYIPISSMN